MIKMKKDKQAAKKAVTLDHIQAQLNQFREQVAYCVVMGATAQFQPRNRIPSSSRR